MKAVKNIDARINDEQAALTASSVRNHKKWVLRPERKNLVHFLRALPF